MSEFTREIKRHIGTIQTDPHASWNIEVNEISWCGKEPKIDIRPWSPDHGRCGKGLSLTDAQCKELYEVLSNIYK